MKKRERKKIRNLHLSELVLYCDFLTDEERQIFLAKMQQYGRLNHLEDFIKMFEHLDNGEYKSLHDEWQRRFLKLENGFAVLHSYPSPRFWGRFYVLLDDNLYLVGTDRKPDPKQSDGDFNHNKEIYVTTIYKNGFDRFKDEKLQELFETINQKFRELYETL